MSSHAETNTEDRVKTHVSNLALISAQLLIAAAPETVKHEPDDYSDGWYRKDKRLTVGGWELWVGPQLQTSRLLDSDKSPDFDYAAAQIHLRATDPQIEDETWCLAAFTTAGTVKGDVIGWKDSEKFPQQNSLPQPLNVQHPGYQYESARARVEDHARVLTMRLATAYVGCNALLSTSQEATPAVQISRVELWGQLAAGAKLLEYCASHANLEANTNVFDDDPVSVADLPVHPFVTVPPLNPA